MAGDWIPATVGLARNRKVLAIAAACGRSRHEVVGLLIDFWGWASNETHDGLLERLQLRDLCTAIGGDESFWIAVVSVGWLELSDNAIRIPRAEQWLTNGAKARITKTKRQNRWRGLTPNVDGNVDDEPSTKASTKGEERKGDISQESHASPDLRFDREAAEPLAEKLYSATGSKETNDPFPWQVAVLVSQGAIGFNAFHESVESLDTAKGENKIGYFRRCLERHVGGKQKLKELLKRVKLTKRFPRGPPAESENGFNLDPDSIGSET